MTGEPVPTWARATALVVGVVTAMITIPTILLGAASLGSTVAQIEHTTTFDVGPAPRLRVDARFGTVAIEAAQDGQIVVHDRRSASSITRSAAASAVRNIAVDVSRQGDLVVVRQARPLITAPEVNSDSTIAIDVPAHTEVDASNVGDLRIQGTDGAVHVQGSGTVDLVGVTLRGSTSLDQYFGEIHLTDVTVAGSAVVTMGIGAVKFDGRLAPGDSTLAIVTRAGDVSVVLPRPTDARAEITTGAGDFHSDGTWLFTPDSVAAPRRWTADLAPNPTGSVTVQSFAGSVSFASR